MNPGDWISLSNLLSVSVINGLGRLVETSCTSCFKAIFHSALHLCEWGWPEAMAINPQTPRTLRTKISLAFFFIVTFLKCKNNLHFNLVQSHKDVRRFTIFGDLGAVFYMFCKIAKMQRGNSFNRV